MEHLPISWLKNLGSVPFTEDALLERCGDYKSLPMKLSRMVKAGDLIRLKRGLYCVNPKSSGQTLDLMAVANCLYDAPSYISLETALSRYGLIPEAVMGMTSVVKGRSKRFTTPIGWFSYQTIPEDLFGIGVRTVTGHLMASPEKALCDYLYTRPNLRITSPKTLASYLEEDVRFDFDEFHVEDASVFAAYAESGHKTGLFRAAERLFR